MAEAADSNHSNARRPVQQHSFQLPADKLIIRSQSSHTDPSTAGNGNTSHVSSLEKERRTCVEGGSTDDRQHKLRRWLIPPPPYFPRTPELPPENLSKSEMVAIAELSKHWKITQARFTPALSKEEELQYSDRAKLRYLKAREFDVKKALSMMTKTVVYRRKSKANSMDANKIAKFNKSGIMYRRGFDAEGRPIVYMRPKNIDLSLTDDQMVKSFVYHMDMAIQSMDISRGVEEIVVVLDYNGYLVAHQPPLTVAQHALEVLADHYPERLCAVFVIDSPWYFKAFWLLVQPFLPEKTKGKITFISSSDPVSVAPVLRIIPTETREDWLGDGAIHPPYYDAVLYWKAEVIHQRHLLDAKSQ